MIQKLDKLRATLGILTEMYGVRWSQPKVINLTGMQANAAVNSKADRDVDKK